MSNSIRSKVIVGSVVPLAKHSSTDAINGDDLEKYRSRCFWWVSVNVPIRELPIEILRRGLRIHGGKEGFRLAARL